MRSKRLLVVSMAAAVALSGCNKARQLPAAPNPAKGCTDCHGGQENLTGAPPWSLPRDASGNVSAQGNRFDATANLTRIEVGAHTAHMKKGVACGSCHVVPARIDAPNHNVSQRATVTFGGLASANGIIPAPWVPGVHTCTNYCHGASLAGTGPVPAPDWLAGPPGAACGTCHFGQGTPPFAGHPAGPGAGGSFPNTSACAVCHTETVNTDGSINYASGTHVNGQLDGGGGHPAGWADPANHGPAANAGLQNCTTCHGANFDGGTAGVSCTACHTTAGHPSWQTECTFCHGDPARAADTNFPNVGSGVVVRANLAGPPQGTQNEAATNTYAVGAHQAHTTDGTFARAAMCSQCHGPTLPADTAHVNTTVAIGWGVTAGNGVVPTPAAGNLIRWNDTTSVPPNCTNFCHGATLAGGLKTSVKWTEGATGAACGSCHAIPLPYSAQGKWHVQRQDCVACHPGYSNASVNLADHIYVGAGPQGLTCTSCHGTTGASAAPPSDTTGASGGVKVGAHQAHAPSTTLTNAFDGPSPAPRSGCEQCHPTVAATNFRHANGSVNIAWLVGATTPSTPTPAAGSLPGGWEAAPNCTNYCHGDFVGGVGKVTVSWTSAVAMTCNSCHGRAAGAVATPPTNHGAGDTDCSTCHVGYTATTVNRANHVNGSVQVTISGCTACHGDATRVPVVSATDLDGQVPAKNLVLAAPPRDSTGGTPTSNQIGAHQAHVNQGATAPALSNALRCVNCHNGLVPTTAPHSPYPANPVAFGNLATAAAAAPNAYSTATRNCANTYCHGQFTGGRTNNTVNWGNGTLAKLACTACHANGAAPQPNYPHPQNATCADCHTGYTATTVTAATHVDGLVTKSTAGCTACHGDRADTAVTLTTNTFKSAPGATGAATSEDTTGGTATSANGVGAHRAHLVGSGGTPRWRTAAIACTECHTLPASNADTSHATGAGTGGALATISWGNLAQDTAFETKTATFARATGCTATYCHDPKSTDTAAGQVNLPSWTGATAQAQCGSCHGLPPTTAAHPANTACSSCHPGYANAPTSASTIAAVNATAHINGALDGGGDCTGCHASAQAINNGPLAGTGSRRAIVGEFKNTWSHKRSTSGGVPANTVVTKYDCGVCHMEGDAKTGDTTAAHQDGYVDLRDPDTGVAIKYANWGGANAGAYTSNATDVKMSRFSRNLSSASLEPEAVSVMINQCLHCHDANGATAAAAQVTGGSPGRPFNTTITGNGYIAGYDISATNTAGSVVNVSTSFDVTNAAYHPVKGKQNNSYVSALRMNAPWNVLTKTGGNLTSWGYLITCWDCHAPVGATGIQTSTVTAHGAVATLRQDNWIVNTTNLCTVCHNVVPAVGSSTSTHGQGSAWQSTGNGTPGGIARTSCWRCHGSTGTARPARPYAAQDAHGVDSFSPAMGSDRLWPVGATDTWKPYAFFRSAGSAGQWNGTVSWRPLSGPGVPAGSAVCSATTTGGSTSGSLNGCGSQGHGPYTPGGMY